MYLERLKQRSLPTLRSREEMLKILQEEEYGYMPPPPEKLTWTVQPDVVYKFGGDKASYSRVNLQYTLGGRIGQFPVDCVIPNKPGKHPFFVHIGFSQGLPNYANPTEELVDEGFAVLSFDKNDVTMDNDDWTDGLAGILYPEGMRKAPTDPGKIAMWAWAAQRVMDYALTVESLDPECGIVCGHSRLGKTALLTAATDERFAFAHSNDSGCSGAALARGNARETVARICELFPYWFCENYLKYPNNEAKMPFDQHFLVASIAPRKVSVGSAERDIFADPLSELLTCIAASKAYNAHGEDGLIFEDAPLTAGNAYQKGCIGYYMRAGTHCFSRTDWHALISFIKTHTGRNTE